MTKGSRVRNKRLDERPGHLIRRLQQISFALFMEQTRAFKITPVQYSAISAVSTNPGIDQTALCNIVALDRSTIGDVVARLEKKKFIKRLSDPDDRRTKSLYATPSAEQLLRDIEPSVARTQELILAPLKTGQRGSFMAMLKQMVHLNNEHSRAPSRPKDVRQPSPRSAIGSAKPSARDRVPKTREQPR